MNKISFILSLLLSLNFCYLNSMEKEGISNFGSENVGFVSGYVDLDQLLARLGLNSSNVIVVSNQDSAHEFITSINATSKLDGKTSKAFNAAKKCNLKALKTYVNEKNINIVGAEGLSLLSASVKSSNFNPAAIDFLIKRGAQADKRLSNELYSPLVASVITAIDYNQFYPLKYLLELKANPFLRNQTMEGNSAVRYARENLEHEKLTKQQHDNAQKVIKLCAAHVNNLHDAVETFDLEIIQQYATPETVNNPSEDKLIPLLRATSICSVGKNNQKEILELLLNTGALVNKIGIINNTKAVALQSIAAYSIETGDLSLIPIFLERGANPLLDPETEKDNYDHSAYSLARNYQTRFNLCQDCNKPKKRASRIKDNANKVLIEFDNYLEKQTFKKINELGPL